MLPVTHFRTQYYMPTPKNKPLLSTPKALNRTAATQAKEQLLLFSNDDRVPFAYDHDAVPVWKQAAAFAVHGTEYRLKPVPNNFQSALTRVMKAMVQLHYERNSWQPEVQKLEGSVSVSLKGDIECVVQFWNSDRNDFVGVENRDGTLHFSFPYPDRWADIGLDWLLAECCGCGRFDCDPAPFRRRPCPNANW
jgi:hypothetical protein